MRPDPTRPLVRAMTLNNVGATALVLVLLGLWLTRQVEADRARAEPLQVDYGAARLFGLVGASVTIPRPVEDGQVAPLASASGPRVDR